MRGVVVAVLLAAGVVSVPALAAPPAPDADAAMSFIKHIKTAEKTGKRISETVGINCKGSGKIESFTGYLKVTAVTYVDEGTVATFDQLTPEKHAYEILAIQPGKAGSIYLSFPHPSGGGDGGAIQILRDGNAVYGEVGKNGVKNIGCTVTAPGKVGDLQ